MLGLTSPEEPVGGGPAGQGSVRDLRQQPSTTSSARGARAVHSSDPTRERRERVGLAGAVRYAAATGTVSRGITYPESGQCPICGCSVEPGQLLSLPVACGYLAAALDVGTQHPSGGLEVILEGWASG